MITRILSILCLMLLLAPSPCRANEPLSVMVSILPLKYFTQHIGGERVQVSVMVPPGASPATYEPKPRQMVTLAQAKLYIAIGVPFEKAWLPRLRSANPSMTIVKGASGIHMRYMQAHHHDHGHGEAHTGTPDPHVWNSPTEAKKLAGNILAALVQADPEGSKVYRNNYDRLIKKVDAVDAELRTLLAGKQGTRFLVYHPSWGYFARDYGLTQIPVELEGKEPGPRELAGIIKMAEKDGITVIFAQPQFSQKSARIVARAINGSVILADPLAEDWADNLLKVGRQLRNALR